MTGKYGITASLAVLVLYCGEIYPTNLRNEGLGLASTAGRIGGMLAPFTVYLVRSCLVLGVTRIWDTYDYVRERPLTTGGGGLKFWAKMTSHI